MDRVITAFNKGYSFYTAICRTVNVVFKSFVMRHGTALMLVLGIGILACGLNEIATAQLNDLEEGPGDGVEEGDVRLEMVTGRIFQLIEGNMGSLIMVMAGLSAIVSAAFGAYRAAVGLLVVAVGAFVLRSLVDIFFDFTPEDASDID